jgi:NitT/TauT family transport system permease protein
LRCWLILRLPARGGADARLLLLLAIWLGAWGVNAWLVAAFPGPRVRALVAVLFGVTLIALWELATGSTRCRASSCRRPRMIGARIMASTDTLWVDVVQTFFKGALSGFAIGTGAAILFALVVDRFDFLRRGLLPVGNFLAALPIIGTAPIMVMWFGFDWPSKAAVVVAMVFFPMLVNTVQGLAATSAMQRDLMRTWSASYWQTLWPCACPRPCPSSSTG